MLGMPSINMQTIGGFLMLFGLGIMFQSFRSSISYMFLAFWTLSYIVVSYLEPFCASSFLKIRIAVPDNHAFSFFLNGLEFMFFMLGVLIAKLF